MNYDRINWENSPSKETPLDADNLNKMDVAIDTLNREVSRTRSDVSDHEEQLDALSSQMSTFVRLEDGSTTGDAELANGRVGYDGTEFDTIGNAIRGQVRGLKNHLVEVSETEPEESYNKIWIKDDDEEIEIPTMADLEALSGEVDELNERLSDVKSALDVTNKTIVTDEDNVGVLWKIKREIREKSLIKFLRTYEGSGVTSTPLADNKVKLSGTAYSTIILKQSEEFNLDHTKTYTLIIYLGNSTTKYNRSSYLGYGSSRYVEENGSSVSISNAPTPNFAIKTFTPDSDYTGVYFCTLSTQNDTPNYSAYVFLVEGEYNTSTIFENNYSLLEMQTYINRVKQPELLATKTPGKNLVDISTSTIGYFISDANGDLSPSSSYDTTDYIPVKQSNVVFSQQVRKLLAYSIFKKPIASSYISDGQSIGYVYTPTAEVAYIRFSYYHSNADSIQAEYGDTVTAYKPFREAMEENVHLSDTMLEDVALLFGNDYLYGKKWVACGDSFTEGDFQHSTEDYTIDDGLYAGKNKVYPYLIGNRTGMVVVNEAISGSTMTYISGRANCFSDTRYLNIPADADYITLKFGINDDALHQNVPMGTIDDNTNTTFYGAWNIVMNYLITHHLDAKIGIIITNGATSAIAEATIAIAEKWGVPYLNEATGKQCSFVFRSNRTDIPEAIRNAKNSNWFVSTTVGQINYHPNVKAHEYESTVVEAWLRTL